MNPYLIIGAITGSLALAAAGFLYGMQIERDRCQAGALRSHIAVLEADIEIKGKAEAFARIEAERLARHAAERQEQIDALAAELDALPADDVCRATDADVERLLRIRPAPRAVPAGEP